MATLLLAYFVCSLVFSLVALAVLTRFYFSDARTQAAPAERRWVRASDPGRFSEFYLPANG